MCYNAQCSYLHLKQLPKCNANSTKGLFQLTKYVMSDQHVYQSAYWAGLNYNVLSRHWKRNPIHFTVFISTVHVQIRFFFFSLIHYDLKMLAGGEGGREGLRGGGVGGLSFFYFESALHCWLYRYFNLNSLPPLRNLFKASKTLHKANSLSSLSWWCEVALGPYWNGNGCGVRGS